MPVPVSISVKSFKKMSFAFLASSFIMMSGCSVNPATGNKEFTPFLPQSAEKEIGATEHRNVVNEFGGEYDNNRLRSYVQKVANRITSSSELPSDYYTVTLLNSPVVNAFALPGGYLYITRGLATLANTEAELAGVLGHESGHVTGRHAAGRSNVQALAGIGAMLAGVLTGNQQIAQLAQIGGQGLIASYSRSDEYEADELGIRYLSKSGYNPFAQADFLYSLQLNSHYDKQVSGNKASAPSFFATHPDTGDRVNNAADLAKGKFVEKPHNGRLEHLKAINGTIWGDDPKQGMIKDNKFIHPDMRFEFTVPTDYVLTNTPSAVIAKHQSGIMVQFDADLKATSRPMTDYLRYEFAKDLPISALQKVNLKNAKDAATAIAQLNTNQGTLQARLFAIRMADNKVYRFMNAAPANLFQSHDRNFYDIASSFRKISSNEAVAITPYFVRYRSIRRGDTIASLSRLLPFKTNQELTFRQLNGFSPTAKLPSSGYVKIITNK